MNQDKSLDTLKTEIRAMAKFLRKHNRGYCYGGDNGDWFGNLFITHDGALSGRSVRDYRGDCGWKDADHRTHHAAALELRETCHEVYKRVSVDMAIDALIELEK